MRHDQQLDLIRHSDAAIAAAYRQAAETARVDPFWTDDQREARARHYLAEASRIEESRE